MKSAGNLTLKNSYKHLQKKMWQISEKAYQINKQNEILKGRISTQRAMIKKRKIKTSYVKNSDEQINKDSLVIKNFQDSYKNNLKLKQKISHLEQQKKEINQNLILFNRLQKKHRKLEIALKKYSNKLMKTQKPYVSPINQDKLGLKNARMSQTIQLVSKEEQSLTQNISKVLQMIQEQKRYHSLVSSQILFLIQEKSKAKKLVKSEKQSRAKYHKQFV